MTALSLNAEDFDTNTFHDVTTNNSRVTVPTGFGGYYSFTASTTVAAVAGGTLRLLSIRKNGTTQLPAEIRVVGTSTTTLEMSVTTICKLVATDYIEAVVYHDQGGNVNYGDATSRWIQSSLMCTFLGV